MAQKSKDDIVNSITIFHLVGLRDWIAHLANWPLLAGTFNHLYSSGNYSDRLITIITFFYLLFLITNLLCVSLLPPQSGFLCGRRLFPIAFSIILETFLDASAVLN